ncbi:MAG: hypothetical protein LAT82_03420 [Nanoarchaeota archaeon]|nr:hypothetical protein [Nanoarchaeota archaeon]
MSEKIVSLGVKNPIIAPIYLNTLCCKEGRRGIVGGSSVDDTYLIEPFRESVYLTTPNGFLSKFQKFTNPTFGLIVPDNYGGIERRIIDFDEHIPLQAVVLHSEEDVDDYDLWLDENGKAKKLENPQELASELLEEIDSFSPISIGNRLKDLDFNSYQTFYSGNKMGLIIPMGDKRLNFQEVGHYLSREIGYNPDFFMYANDSKYHKRGMLDEPPHRFFGNLTMDEYLRGK